MGRLLALSACVVVSVAEALRCGPSWRRGPVRSPRLRGAGGAASGEWDLVLFSPAKVNLFLRVLRKREDGLVAGLHEQTREILDEMMHAREAANDYAANLDRLSYVKAERHERNCARRLKMLWRVWLQAHLLEMGNAWLRPVARLSKAVADCYTLAEVYIEHATRALEDIAAHPGRQAGLMGREEFDIGALLLKVRSWVESLRR